RALRRSGRDSPCHARDAAPRRLRALRVRPDVVSPVRRAPLLRLSVGALRVLGVRDGHVALAAPGKGADALAARSRPEQDDGAPVQKARRAKPADVRVVRGGADSKNRVARTAAAARGDDVGRALPAGAAQRVGGSAYFSVYSTRDSSARSATTARR